MKRLVFCLMLLAGTAGMSSVFACSVKKSIAQDNANTFTGVLRLDWYEICYCWDDYGHECPDCEIGDWCQDCGTPAIVVGKDIYFLNDTEAEALIEQGYKDGDEVEITGYVRTEACVDFVAIATMKKMSAAIEDVKIADGVLDLRQPMYDMLGIPVDDTYRGIVIQNGHKFVRE